MASKVSEKGKKLAQLRKLKLEETSLKAAIAMFEEQLNRLKVEELNLTEKQREQMVSNITKSLQSSTASDPQVSSTHAPRNEHEDSMDFMDNVNINQQNLTLALGTHAKDAYDQEFDEEECLLQL